MTAPGVGYADITDLATALAGSGGNVHAAAATVVREVTSETENYARMYAPVRTGALRASITSFTDALSGTVEATVPYALFVELGTGTRGEFPTGVIHIQPKNGKYLSWIGGNGKRVYARAVNSPGMSARPYLRPALEQAVSELEDKLGAAAIVSIVQGKT